MLFALLIVRASSDDTVQCNLPRALPGWSPALLSFLILLLVIPVSLQPLRANSALAQGYVYHVSDVRRSVASMEKGLALDTYADLGYGYQTYEMYVSEQDMRLEGEMRRIAYMFALSALAANYDRYPYDARTAMYYAHMLDLSPPEIPRNEALLREVVEHTIELSPLRSQAWYLLANISLRQGDRAPRGSLERAQHYEEGIVTLKEYAARVPHMADPRYVIATLYIDIGKGDQAAEWAAEGLAMYKPDEHTARRAARYYIAIEDWHMAARMMRDAVTTTKGIDYNALYDLAKLVWLTGERDEVDILIERIKTEAPGLFESDPNFVAEYSAAQ